MALIDITPIMTSNTTPAPYVVSASSYYTGCEPWKAFNNSVDPNSVWATERYQLAGWIKIDFSITTRVDAISLYNRNAGNYGTQMVKDFIVYGSNDDNNYEQIASFDSQMNWSVNESRLFKFNIAVTFRYYKLQITANNGASVCSEISEIKFYQDDNVEDFITNKKASLIYCLPKNSTLNLIQRQNDPREGMLAYSNDPDDRYGTLHMIDNKGKAIIPKAAMANSDFLFDGGISEGSIITLSNSIENYSYINIVAERSSLDHDEKIISKRALRDYINTYKTNLASDNMGPDMQYRLSLFFQASIGSTLTKTCNIYFTDVDKIMIYKMSESNGFPLNRLKVYGIK